MPDVSGENLVPQGRAGTGAAYILGANVPSALSVIINGQRSRDLAAQRMALAKQKARDEDLKRFSSLLSSVKDDTGLTYQPQHMAEREQVGKDFMATALDETLTPQARQLALDQIKTGYEQRGQMGKQVDDAMKLASGKAQGDHELDYNAVTKRLHDLQYNKDSNVLPVDQFPLRSMDNVLEDPKLFNTAKVYDNFVSSKVAPKEIYQQAVGGKPGTYSRSFTDEIRFLKKNADGTPYHDPITHKTQTEITPELLGKAMENPRIALDLNGLMADHKALTASGEAKMANLEQLTDEERAALKVNPTLTDLLGRRMSTYGYANHHETERYVPVPRPRVAKAGAAEAPYQAPSFDNNGENRYDMPNDGPVAVQGYGGLGQPAPGIKDLTNSSSTGPIKRTDYAVYGTYGASPVDVSKSGKTTNKHVDSWIDKSPFDIMGAEGQREHRIGDMQSMSGYPGKPVGAYVDAKTGQQIYPTSNKIGNEMVGAGAAKLQVQFDFASEKGENFNPTNMKATTEALLKETDNLGRPKYPNPELASAAARKILATSTVRSTHLRNRDNFLDVDRLFGSDYAKHQLVLDRETQRLRAEYANRQQQQAAPVQTPKEATGGAYQRKATTTPNQNKGTKPKTGGAY